MPEGGGFGSAAVLDQEWAGVAQTRLAAIPCKVPTQRAVSIRPIDPGTNVGYRIDIVEPYAGYAGSAVNLRGYYAADVRPWRMYVGSEAGLHVNMLPAGTRLANAHLGGRGFDWRWPFQESVSPAVVEAVAQDLLRALGAHAVRVEAVVDDDVDSDNTHAGSTSGRERVVVYAIVARDDAAALDKLIAFTSTPQWATIVRATDSGIIVDIERA